MVTETSFQGEWLRVQVREILLEADPSAWRAEKEADLRRRVREVVDALRRSIAEARADGAHAGPHDPPSSSVKADPGLTLRERGRALLHAMERALPADASKSRWAAFVGEVHPEYEALVDALGITAAPSATLRPTNYARSVFHFGFALLAVVMILVLPSRGWLVAASGAFVVYAWGAEILRRVFPQLNDRLMRLYGKVAHPHERYRVNSATWYATALILLSLLGTRAGMMAGVVILGVADPVAAAIGRRYGTHKLSASRSLEGSVAFLFSGALAAAFVLGVTGLASWPHAVVFGVIGGLVGALAELGSVRLDDNLTIPLAVGSVVTVMGNLLG